MNHDSERYCEVLKTLFIHFSKKKKKKKKKEFIVHHDNMHPHTSSKTTAFLTKHRIKVTEHPPYRPDLAPCNFWFFPWLMSVLQGSRFDTNEAVVAAANSHFNSIDSSKFAKTWVMWRQRWDKCITSHGGYFGKSIQPNKFLELTSCFLLSYTDFQRDKITLLSSEHCQRPTTQPIDLKLISYLQARL